MAYDVKFLINCGVLLLQIVLNLSSSILLAVTNVKTSWDNGEYGVLLVLSFGFCSISFLLLIALLFGDDETTSKFGTLYSFSAILLLISSSSSTIILQQVYDLKSHNSHRILAAGIVQLLNSFLYAYHFVLGSIAVYAFEKENF